MDEFKLEDELRPDSSDRRPCQRKSPAVQKGPGGSKQHLMIGIGILVLLLLVISIGLALKSPSRPDSSRQRADNNGQRNIDLSGSTSDSNPSSPDTTTLAEINSPVNSTPATVNGGNGAFAPLLRSAPQIASTSSTEAALVSQSSGQQRVKLPKNIADPLAQQENQINGIGSQTNGQRPVQALSATRREPKQTLIVPSIGRHIVSAPAASTSASKTSSSTIQSAPASYYTLQLSGASQPLSLNAYARKQQLSHYWVYETRRDGKPWYVLVNGIYPSLSQAKNAVAQLPADVQAKKPWARQISQVKKDQNK